MFKPFSNNNFKNFKFSTTHSTKNTFPRAFEFNKKNLISELVNLTDPIVKLYAEKYGLSFETKLGFYVDWPNHRVELHRVNPYRIDWYGLGHGDFNINQMREILTEFFWTTEMPFPIVLTIFFDADTACDQDLTVFIRIIIKEVPISNNTNTYLQGSLEHGEFVSNIFGGYPKTIECLFLLRKQMLGAVDNVKNILISNHSFGEKCDAKLSVSITKGQNGLMTELEKENLNTSWSFRNLDKLILYYFKESDIHLPLGKDLRRTIGFPFYLIITIPLSGNLNKNVYVKITLFEKGYGEIRKIYFRIDTGYIFFVGPTRFHKIKEFNNWEEYRNFFDS